MDPKNWRVRMQLSFRKSVAIVLGDANFSQKVQSGRYGGMNALLFCLPTTALAGLAVHLTDWSMIFYSPFNLFPVVAWSFEQCPPRIPCSQSHEANREPSVRLQVHVCFQYNAVASANHHETSEPILVSALRTKRGLSRSLSRSRLRWLTDSS